jgi:hypothetical protein
MKILIAYESDCEDIYKFATAINNVILDEKEMKSFAQIKELDGFDLSIIVLPLLQVKRSESVREFLREKTRGRKVALFITHLSPDAYEGLHVWLARCRELVSQAELVGFFHCQSSVGRELLGSLANHKNGELRKAARKAIELKNVSAISDIERARREALTIVLRERIAWLERMHVSDRQAMQEELVGEAVV